MKIDNSPKSQFLTVLTWQLFEYGFSSGHSNDYSLDLLEWSQIQPWFLLTPFTDTEQASSMAQCLATESSFESLLCHALGAGLWG